MAWTPEEIRKAAAHWAASGLRPRVTPYLYGVRDAEWAGPTERILRARAEMLTQSHSPPPIVTRVIHCWTYECTVVFLTQKDFRVTSPRALYGPWSGAVLYFEVIEGEAFRYGAVVLRRHVRDYPAYKPRVRSTDARSGYAECQGDKAGSCACACFPFELDLSQAKCDASGPAGAPHCICPDRAWGDCNAAISPDYKLLPFPTPTPPEHGRGKPRSR